MISRVSLDLKELQELVEQERTSEEKVKGAKEDAQNILKAAREKAESLVQAIDSDPQWEKLRRERKEEIARRKAEMQEESKRQMKLLDANAQENFEKAVACVVKEALRVKA